MIIGKSADFGPQLKWTGYGTNCAAQSSLRSRPQNGQKQIWIAHPASSDVRHDRTKYRGGS
jgi:hypothetical protein